MEQNVSEKVLDLDVTKFLRKPDGSQTVDSKVALIILNCPIDDYEYFKCLYDQAAYTVCADGGANRLLDLLKRQFTDENLLNVLYKIRPNTVHGDLDSLKNEVRQIFQAAGIEISHDSDQYSTDFAKAIRKILQDAPETRDVLVLGSIGGRVDQGVGLLHEIYREQTFSHPNLNFWLFSEQSISMLLQPGTSTVRTSLQEALITRNVGILPLYGKAILTLQGFEWDVSEWPSEMGGQVSTSNHVMADQLSITTNTTVLFTIERRVEY